MIGLRMQVLLSCLLLFRFGWSQKNPLLFKLLPAAQTGISPINKITESDLLNIPNQTNIYNGGGVGVGDFNNDGLADLYFACNMVTNKLHLNKDVLKFDDTSASAGIDGAGPWCTDVSVGDIDGNHFNDFFINGADGNADSFFMQDARSVFPKDTACIKCDAAHPQEDMSVLIWCDKALNSIRIM